MKGLFEITTQPGIGQGEETLVHIGIPLRVGGHDVMCSISKTCASYETLEIEIQTIKDELDALLHKAKEAFDGPATEDALGLRADMSAEEIWSIFSEVSDEDLFVKSYNSLEENKRRAVAEHVLTRCNVFSGKPALFSSQYNNETAYLE